MLVDFRAGILFTRTSKTASSSTESALASALFGVSQNEQYSFQVFETGLLTAAGRGKNRSVPSLTKVFRLATRNGLPLRNLGAIRTLRAHSTPKKVREILGNKWDAVVKVTTVRNPFDLMVSRFFWHHPNAEASDFESWLVNKNPEPRSNRELSQFFGAADWRWIRFESLSNSLEQVGIERGFRVPDIRHYKRSPGRGPYQAYYTPKSKQLVERIYCDWIDFFGYQY